MHSLTLRGKHDMTRKGQLISQKIVLLAPKEPLQLPVGRRGSMPPSKPVATPARAASMIGLPEGTLDDMNFERLDRVFLVVALLGVLINLIQLVAISNHAWVQGTALKDGQPFTAYLALDSVTFGVAENPHRDNEFFCGKRRCACPATVRGLAIFHLPSVCAR